MLFPLNQAPLLNNRIREYQIGVFQHGFEPFFVILYVTESGRCNNPRGIKMNYKIRIITS